MNILSIAHFSANILLVVKDIFALKELSTFYFLQYNDSIII